MRLMCSSNHFQRPLIAFWPLLQVLCSTCHRPYSPRRGKERIVTPSMPYLGSVECYYIDWTPARDRINSFSEEEDRDDNDPWPLTSSRGRETSTRSSGAVDTDTQQLLHLTMNLIKHYTMRKNYCVSSFILFIICNFDLRMKTLFILCA
jgi:hypothetical protein